jgi:hypothetical protein
MLNKTGRALLMCVVPIILLGSAGCSRELKPDGFPPLYPVKIKVIQGGVPLAGADISLHHKGDQPQKWGIIGTTDKNGTAIMVTHGKFFGAPEGEYCVTVEKNEVVPVPKSKKIATDEAGECDTFSLIELQYINQEKSPLNLQVKKGRNYQEFDVGHACREFVERWM